MQTVNIIGAGLAGCEAAIFLAEHGVKVRLYEQKPISASPAHQSEHMAELVCSNSLGASRTNSASGLLKAEALLLGGTLFKLAEKCSVPAGGALAVNRDEFSALVDEIVRSHELIEVINEVVTDVKTGLTIVATGPMSGGEFAENLFKRIGGNLSYYDAAAPIVTAESLIDGKFFAASRYGRGGDDYLNCPLTRDEYYEFVHELIYAEKAKVREFDKVYEGCMPIEILASRGVDSLRYGPLKPVGLTDPNTQRRPYANLQLRKENVEGTLFNLVGFQTNLKFGEQKRVFGLIPALSEAEYVRYGVMHRNSFINSPQVLNDDLSLKADPNIYIAGGLTGFEGYSESITCGLLAARFVLAKLQNSEINKLPPQTMCGGLLNYILTENKDFQPQGAAMGLLPPLPEKIKDKKLRYQAIADRALAAMEIYGNI